jgi:Transposase DDE domain
VYRKFELAPKPPSEFELTLCGSLSPDNRWVKMAQIIPWSEFESEYAANFPTERGQGKRRFSLNRVMAKLDNTSGTVIAISFLVMNLATRWRRVFCVFLSHIPQIGLGGLRLFINFQPSKILPPNFSGFSVTFFKLLDNSRN